MQDTPIPKDAQSGSPSSTESLEPVYVPAAGDVVKVGTRKIIIYLGDTGKLESMDNNFKADCFWQLAKDLKNPVKVGETDVIKDGTHWDEAREITKKYFSEPAGPQPGDVVDLINPSVFKGVARAIVFKEGYVRRGKQFGSFGHGAKVISVLGRYSERFDTINEAKAHCDAVLNRFKDCYTVGQKAWQDYYNIKKGDELKVVRSHIEDEEGYCGSAQNLVGDTGIFTTTSDEDGVRLDGGKWFPYTVLEPV